MPYYSLVRYVGDGSTRLFSIPFDYIAREYIKVYVDGVEVEFTWVSDNQVLLDKAPPAGSVVGIQRDTPKVRLVDFQNASILDEETLDRDGTQLVHIVQESLDKSEDSLRKDIDDKYDAQGKVIKNVATPRDPHDAVNKAYADEVITRAEAHANQAKAFANQAGNFAAQANASAVDAAQSAALSEQKANEAAISASNAAQSESNALNFSIQASRWANAPQNYEIEPGKYSAYHWATLAHEMVKRMMGSSRYEIPLRSPSGIGYLLMVTEAGSLRTVYSEDIQPERIVLVAEDGSFFEIAVSDEGDIYALPVTEPVADVVPEVKLFAPNGWVYSVTVTPDGEFVTQRTTSHTEVEGITFIVPSTGERYTVFVDENGTLTTVKEAE